MNIKRIGLLTGGGDCPGLNAVIHAVVKSAVRRGWSVVGFRDGFRGVVEGWSLPLDDSAVSGILTRGGTILGTNNRANPFSYTYDARGQTVPGTDRSRDALSHLKREAADALVVVGGDGSLSIALKFGELGLPVVGVPKTIDNDLAGTDLTFGFDSAMAVATDAVDRLHTTAEAHHRVMVLETMGRNAGWIALRAGIAGGGDVILIPEIPYRLDSIVSAIQERRKRGKNFTIVVAAEGARPVGGDAVVQRIVEGSPDPVRLGGVGRLIAERIEKETGIETRVTILGHLQRGGTPTPFDRWLSTRFGVAATECVAQGRFGRMVCLKGTAVESVPIEEAVRTLKRVDPRGEEVEAARRTGTSFGD